MRLIAAGVLLLAAFGCAGGEERPERQAEAEEAPASDPSEPGEDYGSEAITREVCSEFRTMLEEQHDNPSEERVGERLSTIRTLGPLADDDAVISATEGLAGVGTGVEVQEWADDMGSACDQAGY